MNVDEINKRQKNFIKYCAENFDCDKVAHASGTTCRKCEAKEILKAKTEYNRQAVVSHGLQAYGLEPEYATGYKKNRGW